LFPIITFYIYCVFLSLIYAHIPYFYTLTFEDVNTKLKLVPDIWHFSKAYL